MRARDMDRLGTLIRNDKIMEMSNEEICDFLILSKIMNDSLESLIPAFKNEFQRREIGNFENMGMRVSTEKESDSHEVNVDSLFSMLPLSDFLKIVNVVKSKATTPEQKAAIIVNTTTIQKTGRVVKVAKQKRLS